MQTLRQTGIGLLAVAISVATVQGQSRMDDPPAREAPSSCQSASARPIDGAESDCSDGKPSTVLAATAPQNGQQPSPASSSSAAPRPAMRTWACQFSNGPHAGVVGDLTGVPGATPVPVGSLCSDGAASIGTAILDSGAIATFWSDASRTNAVGAGRAGSTICQFMSGPKAHGWHDYAPLSPAPIGSSCQDGMNSAGIVMASGHGEHY
jgi:hypothetical protein